MSSPLGRIRLFRAMVMALAIGWSSAAGALTPPSSIIIRPPPLLTCPRAMAVARQIGPASFTIATLTDVLNACPWLTDRMIWEDGTGKQSSYLQWSRAQRNRFLQIFQGIVDGGDLGLDCPSPDTNALPGSTWVYLTAHQAFDIYAAHVAHALFLELSAAVPWSLFALPDDEAAEILASSRYHARIVPVSNPSPYPAGIEANRDYQLPFRASLGDALNCDPRIGHDFLSGMNSASGTNRIGATELDTLVNITWWFQQNVIHGSPGDWAPGVLPLFLVDRLTTRTLVGGTNHGVVAADGCHSAANLFHDLARSVNIPVLVGATQDSIPSGDPGSGHSGLVFGWARETPRILWHADDMYAVEDTPTIIGPAGSSVLGSEPDAAHNYFDSIWQTPEYWMSRFFTYEGATLVPTANSDVIDLPDFGRQIGHWEPAGNADPVIDVDTNLRASAYSQLQAWAEYYENCSWPEFVEEFCAYSGNRAMFEVYIDSQPPILFAGLPYPDPHRSATDFYARARACVASVGGCAAATSLVRSWNVARGRDGWRFAWRPPIVIPTANP